MKSVRSILTMLTALFVVISSLVPQILVAQDASTPESAPPSAEVQIAIHPKDGSDGSRFEAEVNPGEEVTIIALITNFGAEPIELRTYSSDVVPAANGGLVMAERGSEKHGSSLWMNYPDEEFKLEPQQAIEREMTISVPDGTPPGQYVNAVALETVNPTGESTASFDQYFSKVVSVYITVPGEVVVDFSFGEPQILVFGSLSGVEIPVSNDGNIRIDLHGELTLTAEDGSVVHAGAVNLDPIYMGQDTVIQIVFATLPPAGDYSLSYTLTDRDSGVTKTTESVAVVVPEAESTEVAPISFDNVVVEANADPIVFANVSVDVTIAQANYPSTRLTLSVYHNGEHVEDFLLADNLSLAQGTTTVSQRYLPATGFAPGEYTFSLKLESTEGGQTSLLFNQDDVATVEVP